MKENPGIDKSELAVLSGLTFPTVSSAIKDMLLSKEVIKMNEISKGGRPGAVYKINENYRYIACAYINAYTLYVRIYNVVGMQCEQMNYELTVSAKPSTLYKIFYEIKVKYPALSVIAFGIPGVVLDGIIQYLPIYPALEEFNFVKYFDEKLQVHTFLENDINAITLAEKYNYKNIAHIILNQGCIGSGIIINGQLINGAHGNAGELELLCNMRGSTVEILTQGIIAITCVVDVEDIAISGTELDDLMIKELNMKLEKRLSNRCIPKIHFIKNADELYYRGLLNIAMEYCMEH